jgi:hypothetical protein
MRMKILMLPAFGLAAALAIGVSYHIGEASDHEDGRNDAKSPALNLTDHLAFRSPGNPSDLAMLMYFNPLSEPGRQGFMATNARYEFHVSKAASKTTAPTVKDDFVFRLEAAAPDAAGTQKLTLTVLKDGAVVGTHSGSSTAFSASKSGNVMTNSATVGGLTIKYFVAQRADSFHFDDIRFFQVRAFLAARFFGGANGDGDPTATLADNCRGDKFLSILTPGNPAGGEIGGVSDGDNINLFNPPSCAQDFTKNRNSTVYGLNVDIASLGGAVFDTWSTISVGE